MNAYKSPPRHAQFRSVHCVARMFPKASWWPKPLWNYRKKTRTTWPRLV